MAVLVSEEMPTTTEPRLSVQIVTWNSAEVVDASLASLHAQTAPAMEVIVVDNASTDGSAEVVRSGSRAGFGERSGARAPTRASALGRTGPSRRPWAPGFSF